MLKPFKQIILARFPELAGATFRLLTTGWDSIAVDVNDEYIFKFPRDEDSLVGLRREAAILALVRPRVSLPVPDLQFFAQPRPFSRHPKLKGDHLTTTQYLTLPKTAQQRLAETIAGFYAQLHALEPARLVAAGALPLDPWPHPAVIRAGIQPRLPESLWAKAQPTLDAWAGLPDDPYGVRFGFFDGHGWNMAFDHQTQSLQGIYDFADAGIGEVHQEFIYTHFISPDLTERVITAYQQLTTCQIDRERVNILYGVLLLSELAELGDDPEYAPTVLTNVLNWLQGTH